MSEPVEVAKYRILQPIATGNASYSPTRVYVIGRVRGDKYVDRKLAEKVSDYFQGVPKDIPLEGE